MAPQAAATQGLYERHAAKIQSYCHHQLGSREEAEDAVQTTFMNAFRALGRGVVPEAESAWLFKIAENVCLSRRRSSWRRGRIESPNDFEVIEEIVPGPSRHHDELIGIEDALASMPEQQRRAILLREWQGLSYREVAEELGVSQSAVETLIFRARRSLAQGLEQPDAIKPKRKSFRRALHALDISGALAALKTLLAGSAAVKATAAAVPVTAAAGGAATVTPKVEGLLPNALKAKPTLVAPPATSSRSASTPVSGTPVAYVDQSGSRSVVLTSSAVTANAAERSAKQTASGQVAAVKQRKRSAPSGSKDPSVQRSAAPLAPAPEPASAEPTTVAAGEPVQEAPAAQPAAEPKKPEKPKRDELKRDEPKGGEPKREEPKAEPKQAAAQPRTDEGKQSDEGKKDSDKREPSKKDNGKKEDVAPEPAQSRAPQAVVATPAVTEAAAEPEAKKVSGNSGNSGNSDKGEKGEKSEKGERKEAAAVPPPAVAPIAVASVVVVSEPAVAPAPEPAPEPKERDRGSDRGSDQDKGNGNRDNGKRKGK